MRFGICTSVSNASLAKAAGFDFIEEHIQNFLKGEEPHWQMPASALSILAANCLVPAARKITGPDANLPWLENYLGIIFKRAREAGIQYLVFGSGAARTVPAGFPRDRARQQIMDFIAAAAKHAKQYGITLLVEHLNQKECNIINTVAESMEYVRAINEPEVQCLADIYHAWLENEPLANIEAAMPAIRHVHISAPDRKAPGQSHEIPGTYTPLFSMLKRTGYTGGICIESNWSPALTEEGEAARSLQYVKDQWARA